VRTLVTRRLPRQYAVRTATPAFAVMSERSLSIMMHSAEFGIPRGFGIFDEDDDGT